MALLVTSMSAVPHLQDHMTDAHEKLASSGLPSRVTSVAVQSNTKRPKLSLQTAALANTYGAATRGLTPRADAQATFTPTTTNTLSNTWDLSVRPSPVSRTESPRPTPVRTQAPQQPYTLSLPFGIRPILKNSPLPQRQGSVSASPRDSKRKIFFPQPKRVVFKRDLQDFIETTKYVARHSDLTSSSSEDNSDQESLPDSSSVGPPETGLTGSQISPPPSRKRKNRRDARLQQKTRIEEARKRQSEEDASATTPSKDRKRCKWTFSLASRESHKSNPETDEEQCDIGAREDELLPQHPKDLTESSDPPPSADCSRTPVGIEDSVDKTKMSEPVSKDLDQKPGIPPEHS